jgi:hypothetical protein
LREDGLFPSELRSLFRYSCRLEIDLWIEGALSLRFHVRNVRSVSEELDH